MVFVLVLSVLLVLCVIFLVVLVEVLLVIVSIFLVVIIFITALLILVVVEVFGVVTLLLGAKVVLIVVVLVVGLVAIEVLRAAAVLTSVCVKGCNGDSSSIIFSIGIFSSCSTSNSSSSRVIGTSGIICYSSSNIVISNGIGSNKPGINIKVIFCIYSCNNGCSSSSRRG